MYQQLQMFLPPVMDELAPTLLTLGADAMLIDTTDSLQNVFH